jgi:hypothetical protein
LLFIVGILAWSIAAATNDFSLDDVDRDQIEFGNLTLLYTCTDGNGVIVEVFNGNGKLFACREASCQSHKLNLVKPTGDKGIYRLEGGLRYSLLAKTSDTEATIYWNHDTVSHAQGEQPDYLFTCEKK